MSISEQGISLDRYMVIPRVLIFVTRGDEILLLKLLPRNGKVTGWTGRYNGLGGHIERGEDSLTAARRELSEEAGVKADLRLCGILIVDTGEDVGIGLNIFSGEYVSGELAATHEGIPEWIPIKALEQTPLVDDGSILIGKILAMKRGDPPFMARSFYDDTGKLIVKFGE
jgi:8-oxo-dGTP diphosphatase